MSVNWKKTIFFTLLITGCFAAGAAASNGIQRVDAYLRPDFKVVIDGRAVALDDPVLIYNNYSYIPLKSASQFLNADVNWQDSTQTIYINSRFEGQPQAPVTDSPYEEVTMEQVYPYTVNYLGAQYGLLSITVDYYATYYRVEDLARMGVDTRGLVKVKETGTGWLFVKKEEADKLWKEQPLIEMAYRPVASGIYDARLIEQLNSFIEFSIPMVIELMSEHYPIYPYMFFMDAAEGYPDYYYLLGRDYSNEIIVFVLYIVQDDEGRWVQKSYNVTTASNLRTFMSSR